MGSLRRHEGYLLIDHSSSPGTAGVGEGQVFEAATLTCAHCQRVLLVNPDRTRTRCYCAPCDHYICDPCGAVAATSLTHRPFAAVVDHALAHIVRAEQADKGTIWLPPSPLLADADSQSLKE